MIYMNNKGQVLVIFILIIPLLLVALAYVVDNTYIAYHMNKLNQLNYLVLNDASKMELTNAEISDYVHKNDSEVRVDEISITSNKIEIILKKEIKSIFGNIIGIKNYELVSKKNITVEVSNEPLYQ